MKRYSISIAYGRDRDTGKISFHYWGRTDYVDTQICRYREDLARWINRLNDEGYEYRDQIKDYHGIKITDSQTKKVVFQESHLSEEYGWRKIWTKKDGVYGSYWAGKFERI